MKEQFSSLSAVLDLKADEKGSGEKSSARLQSPKTNFCKITFVAWFQLVLGFFNWIETAKANTESQLGHNGKKPKTQSVSWIIFSMGITGYGISRPVIQNYNYFCIRTNIPKENYWIFRIGLIGSHSSLHKSEIFKLIISFFHYFWCQNWDQWYKMSGKNTHIYIFYFWFKNKRVWAEKIGKNRKNSINLKIAGNYPNI